MSEVSDMKIGALSPWFGGNRTLANLAGEQLGKLAWCGVPFMGGASELPTIRCRAGLANDLHRHIINVARVIRDEKMKSELVDRLDKLLFHPDELRHAQLRCATRDGADVGGLFGASGSADEAPNVEWAADYFVCCWMCRGGQAGKKTEFTQGLAVRFTSSGGGSRRRFQSAAESLDAWHRVTKCWEFTRMHVFDFLRRCADRPDHGLYIDAPWPVVGAEYRHGFSDRDQVKLRDNLAKRTNRVVIRYGDHPFIRELYPEGEKWTWIRNTSKNQKGNDVEEVLIVNGPAFGGAA